jgi:hypothetical protein
MTARVAHIEIERRIRKATRDMLAEQECNGFLSQPPADHQKLVDEYEADEQDYYNRDSKRDTLEAARLCLLALILFAVVAWVFG